MISDIQIQADAKIRRGPPCEVCQLLGSLPDNEAAALRTLLGDPTVRYSVLSDALRDDPDTGLVISANTLSRHARGRCDAKEKLR